MTLKEWSDKQPVRLLRHGDGQPYISDIPGLIDRPGASNLDDYRVTGVAAGVIWFYPKRIGRPTKIGL